MADRSPVEALAALLEETGRAHHRAFEATDGADPDWALWYADHLQQRIRKILGTDRTKTELVVALVDAESEHQARFPHEPWPHFYAKFFCERYTCEPDERLALYYTPTCPFCVRVLRVIDQLDIDVELRDIWANEHYRKELRAARGRATVPVLRCTSAAKDRWMPESADIVRYLRERFETRSNSDE
ncbi:MAG: glutaredoxin [Polyangiales bacterium]